MKHLVYIGIGSNLNNPLNNAKQAIKALKELEQCHFIAASSLYGSAPMGPQDQPDYINAVAKIETDLSAEQLLKALQKIEQTQGRERKAERWGPRTLDLDILLYGQEQIQTEQLSVPHYGMKERDFVLFPLAEIEPDLVLPCGSKLQDLLQQCPSFNLHKIS